MSEAGGPEPADGMLLRYVAERDVPCPVCKYNLRNAVSTRCPECGEELRLSVGAVEQKLGLWLLMAIPLWIGGGLGVLVGINILRWGLVMFRPLSQLVPIIGLLLCIPGAGATVMFRRRFMRASKKTRLQLSIGSLVFVVLTIAFVMFR